MKFSLTAPIGLKITEQRSAQEAKGVQAVGAGWQHRSEGCLLRCTQRDRDNEDS